LASNALRLRAGALLAAAGLAVAGVAVASPAAAEPIDSPVISLDQTSFPAGDWQGGFTVTGSGFDGSVPEANLAIAASGENGGGLVFEQTIDVAEDGSVNELVIPNIPTQAPDADGYPMYFVTVGQDLGEDWLGSNAVELTITEGVSLTVAPEVTVEQVTAGISAQFAGFDGGEGLLYSFILTRWTEADGEQVIDEVLGEAIAGEDGAGTLTEALAGAQVGDSIRVEVLGATDRIAAAYALVVATPAPAPAPAPAAPAATPAAPQLPETGVELGAGFAALALLVLGAGAILVTRRSRATQG